MEKIQDQQFVESIKGREIKILPTKQAKPEVLTEKILDCGKDCRKLFDLVSNITGTTKENPLPKCSSDKVLVDQFAEFFPSFLKW